MSHEGAGGENIHTMVTLLATVVNKKRTRGRMLRHRQDSRWECVRISCNKLFAHVWSRWSRVWSMPEVSRLRHMILAPRQVAHEDDHELTAGGTEGEQEAAGNIQDDDPQASSGSRSRKPTDVTGAGCWPRSSTPESIKQMYEATHPSVALKAARVRVRKGYKECARRQQQFSHDTCGHTQSVLLRPGQAKHLRGGAR